MISKTRYYTRQRRPKAIAVPMSEPRPWWLLLAMGTVLAGYVALLSLVL